jgi:hypothetical protein
MKAHALPEVPAMWRVLLLASLFAVLGLGTAAYAECTSCLTSVIVQRRSTDITLSFTARADDEAALPGAVTAVVMQVDGNRTKCQTITLSKASGSHGVAVYAGTFSAYGTYSHSGRVELAGQIYEFAVPLDGTPGKVEVAADQTALNQNGFRVQITAAPVTPAPTVAPARLGLELPQIDPAFLIGAGVVFVTVVGAYIDRRRALARSLAA